jgi:hypothetical protein
MENIYFQKPYVTVGFDKTTQAVCVMHHVPQTSSEFRLTILKGIECFKQHMREGDSLSWLSDTRKQGALSQEDILWCSELLKKECIKLQKMALVMPQSLFGTLTMEQFVNQNNQKGIANRVFASVNQAKGWLLA